MRREAIFLCVDEHIVRASHGVIAAIGIATEDVAGFIQPSSVRTSRVLAGRFR